MLNRENIMVILGVCAIVLILGTLRRWGTWWIGVFLRGITGALGIYLVNMLLPLVNISVVVGLNLFNLLVVGILGLPGFGLLYGISAMKIL